jgi:hypothetical protein
MAPQAVVLYHLFSFLLDKDYLGFLSQGKHGGMPETVLGLKIVLIKHVVVRDVTVVARGPLPVRAVTPGGILRGHNVAVYTGGRIVGQVGIGPGDIKYINEQASQES